MRRPPLDAATGWSFPARSNPGKARGFELLWMPDATRGRQPLELEVKDGDMLMDRKLWLLGSGVLMLAVAILSAMQVSSRPARLAGDTVNASGLRSMPEPFQPMAAEVLPPDASDADEPWETAALAPSAALKGTDLRGQLHRPGESHDCRAVVVVFLGIQCPISNSVLPRLSQLAETHAARGVEVFGIISSHSVSRAEARRHSDEFNVTFPILFDASGELRSRLKATHTPQAFVLSHDGKTQYSGAFDDQFPSLTQRRTQPTRSFVSDAVEDILHGRAIRTASTEPIGCLLEQLAEESQQSGVTFAREIAPIIYGNCTQCHRDGAVAPFPLISYADVRRHAAQIRLMVELRLMPPWKPVRGFGHFKNEMVLTQREIDLIRVWVDDGMPLGDESDLPERPQFADGWQLGEPDLIIDVPAFDVPADGPDIYQYFVLPTGMVENRLVTAIEYRSSHPQLVHHASFRYDDAGQARKLDEQDPRPGYQLFGGWGFTAGGTLGGWSVGVTPQRLPAGFGRPIIAGSDFVVQTHYHPIGRTARDQARVGVYFSSASARRRIGELLVATLDLHIPPNARGHRHRANYTLPMDTVIHGVMPHTHLLGRETRAVAVLPDGRVEPLVWIEDWDFNWQSGYQYIQPLRLPAGTRIEFDVVFDNSLRNPQNPHVYPRWVHWGEESTDEMAVCFFDVSTPDDADLDELIRHNRQYIDAQLTASP